MRYDPTIAAIRFGMGLAPDRPRPEDAQALLSELDGMAALRARFPLPPYAEAIPLHDAYLRLNTQAGQAGTTRQADQFSAQMQAMRRAWQGRVQLGVRMNMARAVAAPYGMGERLVRFWADHFTVLGKRRFLRDAVSSYVDEAIRPHVAGDFAAMLKAAVLHVAMLLYLDQQASAGPGSAAARRDRTRGLNENLAREVLELHTLGVSADYSQGDVRQLAKLFAGLSVKRGTGFVYRPNLSEPGPEVVLGRSYDGGLEAVHAVLDDLARHPATARHIARKLAVHFVGDQPDPGLVDHIAAAFRATGGDLRACYAALLEHPAAHAVARRKVRQPFDYLAAAMRALALDPGAVAGADRRQTNLLMLGPMRLMGHAWERPDGPDGLPEEAAAWLTPQALAARIHWAMQAPRQLRPRLPDPRDFVTHVLGDAASDDLRFAAGAAASRPEGVGLVLAAPEFQRR